MSRKPVFPPPSVAPNAEVPASGDQRAGPPPPSAGALDLRHVSLLWAPPEQAEAFARIHAEQFPAPWDMAAIAGMLAHPGSVAMMATGGDPRRIGAFVLAQVAADEAEVLTIAVEQAWQRKGIGARLIDGVKRAASRAGARSLFLEVAESNAAARGLYAKSGFTETGRRKGYYALSGGKTEDAIALRAELSG